MENIEEFVRAFGDVRVLAKSLHVSPSTVRVWMRQRRIPLNRVCDIERRIGVSRCALAPDFFSIPRETTPPTKEESQ